MLAKATNGGPKKLVIKPLKVRPKLPEDFERSTWKILEAAVHAVHAKRPIATSLEQLYRAVEDLCTHKLDERLYTQLRQVCDTHIAASLASLERHLSSPAVVFLPHIASCWADHCHQMLMIRSIFLYLDRTFVISHMEPGARSMFDMGLHLFARHLAALPQVQQHTVEGLLALIHSEREGDAVDRGLLKALIRMFYDLGTYASAFQAPFLEQTRAFYAAEGGAKLGDLSVSEYLLHCESRLEDEYERCRQYVDPGTRGPVIAVLEQELLARHMEGILDKGFKELMDGHRLPDLARLYQLCGRIGFLDRLKLGWRDYIRSTGKEIVAHEEKDKEMVPSLLQFKLKMDQVLQGPLQASEAFLQAQRDAFHHFINQRENKPAELIAKYVDGKMRGGSKSISDIELETDLDHALMLFRFLQGKDVFEAFYKKDLAKRLLLGRSASVDAEKSMITKLKAECGAQFTNKLEGMFTDIDLSRDLMPAFKALESTQSAAGGVDLQVVVLTSGYWPTYPSIDAKLPGEMVKYQELFMSYYLAKHGGRRLVWHNSLGHCTVRADFPKCKGIRELQVSVFQSVVLLLFNDVPSMTYTEVQEATGIEEQELKRTLQSLACGKVRVLSKKPMSRDVADTDTFSVNDDFTHPMIRIKINTIQLKETAEENKKTNDAVYQDRQHQIDAAVVRIMKTRKSLSHKLLIQELMTQLKFAVKGTDLKKRIENLIDREYMERDAASKEVYNYLA